MIRVAIVGLGRIGCGTPGDPPRSHLAAVAGVEGLLLVAAIDPSPDARDRARAAWSLDAPLHEGLESLAEGAADIIAVAVPLAARPAAVLAAIEKTPRVLIVEKPFAASLAEAEQLAAAAARQGVALRVNFPRRFDPGHQSFRAALVADPRHVVVRYGKGLFNYGSHMVDLLLGWFGPFASVAAFGDSAAVDDPSLSFHARLAGGFDATFVGIDGLGYDQFEVEFHLADRRLELVAGGVEKWRQWAIPDRYYAGYTQLGPREEVVPAAPVGGFRELYRAARDHLDHGAPLGGCGPEDAAHGIAVLDAVRRSAAAGGKRIAVAGAALARDVRSRR